MSTIRGAGRYAPTPSGELHVGNLRTALLAWLFARSTGRRFLLRIDDLDPDRSRAEAVAGQLADLAAVGVTFDNADDPLWESRNHAAYAEALAELQSRGLVYECYCTRREVLDAPSAPHSPPGAYPGTCRNLSDPERARLRRERPRPALRLRAGVPDFEVTDMLHGTVSGVVDDMVLRRGDGAWAYNLAVVVDDAAQGVDQVVRGDDLLSSAPRQAYVATVLGYPVPEYAHVPLVLGPGGRRLAKRDGAVTLGELTAQGRSVADVVAELLQSLALPGSLADALVGFAPKSLPQRSWVFPMAGMRL